LLHLITGGYDPVGAVPVRWCKDELHHSHGIFGFALCVAYGGAAVFGAEKRKSAG